ncbi:MAG: UDP-N-acetylmuramoyl-L-alanyl-D-glutamate--2,6-diaminopimelate ligase [Oscillospiraceae bacterium]|jgi:UDP-N-acetylmuramoyl-L-alanyl-D-glutamate--2,6-diaminopimelate ligase|nr:UDP-N-acetylmuramoyl-L-alanyl-D-glutamate--2,6-diaminopimelate ligase [Oscillospiraceae bacterium]
MRLHELLEGLDVQSPIPEDREIQGISYDTRTIRPGEIYVALRGYKTDGHRYISEAQSKGAAAVVAEEGEGVIQVSDSRKALALLSANWFGHPARELAVVGVTGTNGKTTVTTLLWRLLQQALGTSVGLLGTNEIRVGEEGFPARRTTPESYEVQYWLRKMVEAGCTHAVMEVSSHALCMSRVEGIQFAVGAFTNLTQDHLDFHRTMEAYEEAKGRLFRQCDAAVLNWDDPAGKRFGEIVTCDTIFYSKQSQKEGKTPHLQVTNWKHFPGGTEFQLETGEGTFPVRLNIPGDFTVSNALCVLGCAKALGIPVEKTAALLSQAPGVKGRMEVVPHKGPGTVIIDYAHTPDALKNALSALRSFTSGRLICLFGCGGDRDRGKRAIMGAVAAEGADLCVVTSDNPRSEAPEGIVEDVLRGMVRFDKVKIVEPDRVRAIRLGLSLLKEGDTLLLAGKGHETYQEVKGEKHPLDEREIVANAPEL